MFELLSEGVSEKENEKTILIFRNGMSQNKKFFQLTLTQNTKLSDIIEIMKKKMHLKEIPTLRLFNSEGVEFLENDL